MMNAEFDSSMGYSKYNKKVVKINYRNGEFEPKVVSKNKRDVSGIEDKIIRGLSTREINEQIQDLYGIDVFDTMLSNITDSILPKSGLLDMAIGI